jgi:predicted RNA binding protein YcfA (HicA-like mRNA interferase family)
MYYMSKTDKLLLKLKNGTISGKELRTLMNKLGWTHARTNGSHETWEKGSKTYILATHSKDLKAYQIKQAQKLMIEEDQDGDKEGSEE